MLKIRIEGDLSEAEYFLRLLQAGGADITTPAQRQRAEGFWHLYTTITVPGYTPPAGPGPAAPVHATATIRRGRRELGR